MPRDIELIKKDIELSELRISNCALQADGHYKFIEILERRAADCKLHHDRYVKEKADFEAELAEAMKCAAPTPPAPAPSAVPEA